MTSLIGWKISGLRPSPELQTDVHVKAVQELSAEHVPLEKIYDRHEVKEAFLQSEICDSGGPILIHSRDRADFFRIGKRSDGSPRTVVRGFR